MRQVNQLSRILLKSTLVLALLLSVSDSKGKAEGVSSAASASTAEQYLFASANMERQSRGLRMLSFHPVLAQAAAFHARQMAEHADISHEFPGELDLAARAARVGIHFSLISENVAEAPEVAEIHEMWMRSEGHRENLLDPDVNVAGIAVIARDGQLYAVEDFASIVDPLTLDEQESAVANLVAATGINVVNRVSADAAVKAARETCTMSTGYAGARKPWFVMRYTTSALDQLPSQLKTRLDSGKYHQAVVGACPLEDAGSFTGYNIAVLLYP